MLNIQNVRKYFKINYLESTLLPLLFFPTRNRLSL